MRSTETGADGKKGGKSSKEARPRRMSVVEVVHHNANRILNELYVVERAVRYVTMERAIPAAPRRILQPKPDGSWPKKESPYPVVGALNDALSNLTIFERFDDQIEKSADQCLKSPAPWQQAAARLVLLLKRIGAQTVAVYREGDENAFHRFHLGLFRPSRTKNSRAALRNLDEHWKRTTSVLANLTAYLASVDLPRLSAELDAIRLQLRGPFIPTPRQIALHAVLVKSGGCTKKQLAAALNEPHEENLYRHSGWGLTDLRSLGFVAHRPQVGYVAVYDLPHVSRVKGRASSLPKSPPRS